jgi:hypothetical protein
MHKNSLNYNPFPSKFFHLPLKGGVLEFSSVSKNLLFFFNSTITTMGERSFES